MIREDIIDEPITYKALENILDRYTFTQSWAFKMFPGIHYNFSCRVIPKHSIHNTRVEKRRRNSLVSRSRNIDGMSDEIIRGPVGFGLLKGYVRSGIPDMIYKLVERGVNVNQRDEDGNTLLQYAASHFKDDIVTILLNIKGIDKTGAIESVEKALTKLMDETNNEEQKKKFRKDADDVIAKLRSGGRRKTRVRSRRIRKTRRIRI
jgi:hypothetical protein